MKVSLLHTTGKVISQKEGFWNEIKAEINTHLMAQSYGIYLLNIIYGDKNKTFKILKQ